MTDAELIAAARMAGMCFPNCWSVDDPDDMAPHDREQLAALRRFVAAVEAHCPHIATTDEGTSYCRLAEVAKR